jgi:hypothetical protein
MPTATDLVTDLPADFEVFGQAVATSMADLLGGTSGQILAKNSNTDMDFVWIANDQGDITGITAGTGITVTSPTGPVPTVSIDTAVTADLTTAQTLTSKTLTSPVLTTPSISNINAKGDILVGTADNTLGVITSGSNGETLVADSSTSTGLRYQAAYNGNQIIGGGFDNWQRGTSFTAGAVYSADRWYLNAVSGTTTVSRDTDVPTGLAGNYSIKQLTAAGSSFAQWSTPLETATVVPLQGRAVVLSYYMKKNATWSGNFSPNVYYSNSTDALASQTTSVTVVNVIEPTPTTSWARYYTTFTVPSDAKGLLIQFNPAVVQASGASLNMAGVQLEIGSVPTSFKRAGETIQGELAACQRYYWRSTTSTSGSHGIGATQSAASAIVGINLPVTMRVVPTSIDFANLRLVNYGVAAYSITTITLSAGESTQNFINIDCAGASGMTANRPVFLYGTGSAGYIGANAEL